MLKEFKRSLLTALRDEYRRPDGWRFPLFDRERKLFDPALFSEKTAPRTPVPSGVAETRLDNSVCAKASYTHIPKTQDELFSDVTPVPPQLELPKMDEIQSATADNHIDFVDFEEQYYLEIGGSL